MKSNTNQGNKCDSPRDEQMWETCVCGHERDVLVEMPNDKKCAKRTRKNKKHVAWTRDKEKCMFFFEFSNF